jgi:hypothetical protein
MVAPICTFPRKQTLSKNTPVRLATWPAATLPHHETQPFSRIKVLIKMGIKEKQVHQGCLFEMCACVFTFKISTQIV